MQKPSRIKGIPALGALQDWLLSNC